MADRACQQLFILHDNNYYCASFLTEDDVRTDMCKHVTKSDRLLKKYAGDVFADTQLDEEFHSIVDRDVTAEE